MVPNPPAVCRRSARRAGFTLVELLVAAALTVLVMAILATAFQQGMETLSHLKSAVGLSQQLRSYEGVFKLDLDAPHLASADDAVIRVSQDLNTVPPGKGYFRVEHGSAPVAEGTGDDGVQSYRATDHRLSFTARRSGKSPQDVFVVGAEGLATLLTRSKADYVADPVREFAGEWAEVSYFLEAAPGAPRTRRTDDEDDDDDDEDEDGDGGSGFTLPLYTLRRRVQVLSPVVDTPADKTATAEAGFTPTNRPEVSFFQNAGGKLNTPDSVADAAAVGTRGNAANRPQALTTGPLKGSDIVLTNVVSMQVLVMTDPPVAPATANDFSPRLPGGTFLDTAAAPRTHRLKAVQMKIRIFDPTNAMTRQMTITQDL